MYNKLESYATENSRHSTNWLLTYSQVLGLRLIAWIEQMCSEIIYTGKFSEKTFSVIFNFYHQEWSISKHCWSIFKSFFSHTPLTYHAQRCECWGQRVDTKVLTKASAVLKTSRQTSRNRKLWVKGQPFLA